jgi:hypothetical protein
LAAAPHPAELVYKAGSNENFWKVRMMVEQILALLQRTLNGFLGSKGLGPDPVVISNIMDHDGRVVLAKEKIALVLINMVHEQATAGPANSGVGPNAIHAQPPFDINLFVLFFANFQGDQYAHGLTMISETISCFHQTAVFTRVNAPDLPPSIDKLALEYTNLNISELDDVMRMIGVRYLPSVCYKVKTLPFTSAPQS